jgi:hypothetical protein
MCVIQYKLPSWGSFGLLPLSLSWVLAMQLH